MGIRVQLGILIPLVVAAGLVTMAFVAAEQQRIDAQDDLLHRGTEVLEAVGVPAAVAVAQNDVAGLDTLIAHVTAASGRGELRELMVLDETGRVLAHSDPERFNTVCADAFCKAAIRGNGTSWRRTPDALWLGVPAQSGIRWATVVAQFSLDQVNASARRTRVQWLAFAFGLVLLMALGLFLGVDRVVVQPVRALQAAVRRMGEGSLNARASPAGGRELSELARNVNAMAEALQHERNHLEQAVAERTRELQEANARLERMAVTDGLTGAYNHRRFQEGLAAEVLRSERNGYPCAVLMVDVDLFKRVNDSLGHPRGDELLRQLAAVLASTLRQTDLFARYGGEEFAALLPETSRAEAAQVAERMRAAVEAQLTDAEWRQKITVSIGVSVYPDDGKTPEQVLVSADQALYLAKHQGRNRVVIARAAA
ncbi:MAG: diguanylate cyclase [Myxococcaceae bacterium]|nr:diguanylate cyclase [Myxococcaceae bacterium]